ncbi:MAG: ABC transporter substrate-binding protein [Deltaproteobacteria bacterium]|nr:ABC transporter substrate-binding protein [Deltaproteobacteria bacterium]
MLFCLAAFLVGLSSGPVQTPKPGGREVTDMTGRTVVLDGPAEQVFILTPVLWHYLSTSLDDGPVVKIPPYMRREFSLSVLGRLFPDLKNKAAAFTNFGHPGPISVEEVLEARPDAALVWDYMSQGLELVNFQGLMKTTADGGDKTKLFRTLGELTGQEDRVRWLWERYERERDAVAAEMKDCVRPVRIAILGTTGFALWGPPSQRFLTGNLSLICGRNVAEGLSSTNGQLNLENLMRLEPDVIYLNPYVLDQTDLETGAICADPRFQGLEAVRRRRVYHMPLGASRLEGPVEAALSLLWLRLTMHPDAPSALDLRQKVRETYRDVYGYDMSDEEIDVWLRLEENSPSAFYGQFAKKGQKLEKS